MLDTGSLMNSILSGRKLLESPISLIAVLTIGTAGSFLIMLLHPGFFTDRSLAGHFIAAIVFLIISGVLILFLPSKREEFSWMENYLLLLFYWFLTVAAAAWIFSSSTGSLRTGLSESIAAMTLTNASLLAEDAPFPLLIFRSFLPLAGSIVITILNCYSFVLMTGCMKSSSGVFNKCLFSHETTRMFSKVSKVTISAYLSLSLIGFLLLLPVYSPFDALAYMSSALSSGGYLPYGTIPNDYARIVQMVLMSVGLLMLFLTGRTVFAVDRHFRSNAELFSYTVLLILIIALIDNNLPFLHRLYDAVSVLSGTGFSSLMDILVLPVGLIILFLGIGGLSCAPSGGLKEFRILILIKGSVNAIKKKFQSEKESSHATLNINSVTKVLNLEAIEHVFLYSTVYLGIALAGVGVSVLLGYGSGKESFRFILSYMHFTFTGGLNKGDLSLLCTGMILGRFAPLPLTYLLMIKHVKKV